MTLTLDARVALVVIDVQEGVVTAPAAPHKAADVVERSARLAAAFRERELPVVLVRVTGRADGADAPPGRTDAPSRAVPLVEGWDTVVALLTGPDDVLVTKRGSSAFYGTDLDLHLRRRRITQVVLAGIATSRGVESTARAAYDHGYTVALVVDAMTDLDAALHEHAVRHVFPRLGEAASTADVLRLLTAPATGLGPRRARAL